MRILFYFAWTLDRMGGAEAFMMRLAEALSKRGHTIGIIEMVETRLTQPMQGRMHTFEGPMWSIPVAYPGRRPRSWISVLRSLRQFQSVVSRFKPDVVSVHCPSWQSIPVVGALALPHKWRLAVTAHGNDIRVDPVVEPKVRPWLNRLFKRADAVTAVSDSLWRDVVDQYPFARHKGSVIYNGVGASWFESSGETRDASQEPYVLYAGRFRPIKGVDILLRAWKLLQARALELTLQLAGDGEEMNYLRALSEDLGVAKQIRFLGRVQPRELATLYRNAELVVIPSRNEGLCLVALEAGASGAICVTTRVGGLPEVIEDKVTGFLVEPESPEALADGLLHALQLSPEDRQRMSAAAKSRIEQYFSEERMAAGYEGLFRSLLGPVLPRQESRSGGEEHWVPGSPLV